MRGAWAPAKGRGSSARRVEMGGVGEENDGMLKVEEDGRNEYDVLGGQRRKKRESVERGGYPVSRASKRKSGIEIIIDFAPTADPASPMT